MPIRAHQTQQQQLWRQQQQPQLAAQQAGPSNLQEQTQRQGCRQRQTTAACVTSNPWQQVLHCAAAVSGSVGGGSVQQRAAWVSVWWVVLWVLCIVVVFLCGVVKLCQLVFASRLKNGIGPCTMRNSAAAVQRCAVCSWVVGPVPC